MLLDEIVPELKVGRVLSNVREHVINQLDTVLDGGRRTRRVQHTLLIGGFRKREEVPQGQDVTSDKVSSGDLFFFFFLSRTKKKEEDKTREGVGGETDAGTLDSER